MGEPRLRFKADDGSEFPAWEEKTFWDVFANLTNNTLSRECLNAESGQARNIHYGDVLVKYGVVVDVQRDGVPFVNPDVECKRWDCLKDGDVVIADTAEDETVGKAVEISNAGSDIVYSGLHTIACRPKEEFAPGYLGNYINSMSYHDQLRPYMQGIKVTSVSKTNIGLTHLLVPTLPEQRKISDCLSAVDAVIAAQQAEVDTWEQRKKGVMQKLFSQEVRFKADDGSDFPDWEDKTLGELFHISAGGDIDKNNCAAKQSKDYPYPVYANALVNNGTYGYANYYKIDGDTFTVTGRGDVGHAVARHCMYVPIVRLLVCQPNMDDDVDFFAEQINYTRVFIESTGVPQLTAPQLSKIKVRRPTLPEQRKIADCLASMDEVIQKSKGELAKWRELKKGLLQQMFV